MLKIPWCRWLMVFLGGGNSNMFGIFIPKIGEDSHFDSYFSNGLKPPTSIWSYRYDILQTISQPTSHMIWEPFGPIEHHNHQDPAIHV